MKDEPVDLTIKFTNKRALDLFAAWLCNAGEQQYWEYASYQNEDEDAMVRRFCYHGIEDETKDYSDKSRYQPFMVDNTIRTIPGKIY